MAVLHIDFESRSTLDLKAYGLHNYSVHPTTDVWCMAWAIDDGPVQLWTPAIGNKDLHEFIVYVDRGGIVKAHNAAFELAIWNEIMVPRYGWPVLKPGQMRCTMAMAYAMGLPGALDNAAAALGLDHQKDQAGHRLMLQMARPRAFIDHGPSMEKCPQWWDEPEKLERLYAYCKQDVEVERELDKRLMPLSPAEQEMWVLDYYINQRGLAVDLPAIDAAIKVVESEAERLNGSMRRATDNFVGFTTETARLTEWVRLQGVDVPGVAKADVLDALADQHLPDAVRAALLIRQEAGKSSTAKLKKMRALVSSDGRVRNTKQYHAAHTGRWGGRGIQPDNMPRPREFMTPENIDDAIAHFHDKKYVDCFYGPVLSAVSDCLRGVIVAAPGHDLIAADFANIEGRGLAWLAGEEWKLQAFRDYDAILGRDAKGEPIRKGPDLYLVSAAVAYGVDVSTLTKKSPERKAGKTSELAFGFQGGVGAWRNMEKNEPDMPRFPDEKVDGFKNKWREKHPATVRYWYALEEAAINAVRDAGQVYSAGAKGREVHFKKDGSFLWCLLPSGRVLCYPYPQLEPAMTPWGQIKDKLTYMGVDSLSKKWVRQDTYGGSLSENVTQAVCRDILAEAIKRLTAAGFNVVMHVHDEAIVEVPETLRCEDTVSRVEEIMQEPPTWAAGLPIVAEGWRGSRYRK